MKTKRTVNYRSPSTPATVEKHRVIRQWLMDEPDGFTVSELAQVLGISRQACLYHVKKMAASFLLGVVMQLEPALSNNGLQFRIYHESRLAEKYARKARPSSYVSELAPRAAA